MEHFLIGALIGLAVGAGGGGYLLYKYGRSVESKAQAIYKAVKS